MKLTEILQTVHPLAVEGSLDRDITGISYDSRRVKPGNLFFAMPGEKTDGHRYVEMAIDRGAAAIVFEHDTGLNPRATQIRVDDARQTLALAAASFYNHPSQQLKVVGVTGTNGKTTTAFMVKAIMEAAGLGTGMLGTVQYQVGNRIIPAARTTPESVEIQDLMSQMLRAGCKGVAMEVSSHALDRKRVAGIDYDVAIFTNLTQDHLDYHETMEEYFKAKSRLFAGLGAMRKHGQAVVNADNEYGRRLIAGLGGENAVVTYGVLGDAMVSASDVRVSANETYFVVRTPLGSVPVTLPLIGRYNVHNALAAIGAAVALGIDLETIERALATMPAVPGRLEKIQTGQPFGVYVDYAHTEDALRNVLATVGELTKGRLICVFGCGGDRDTTKRKPMGAAAFELADFSILTSDNPRTEDPCEILRQVEAGFPAGNQDRYVVMSDRLEAIERALDLAQPGDSVLIAGKGHEAYQEFADTTVPFSDRQVVEDYFRTQGVVVASRSATAITVTSGNQNPIMRVGDIAKLCNAQILQGNPATPVQHVGIDSRALERGDCFIALRGPNFDGHEFLDDAAQRGASAAVVSHHPTRAIHSPSALALLQVPDTLTALHTLATNYRRQMPPTTRVIGITGSSGKTTTKEMIAAVLGQRFSVTKTTGNKNNHIGMPLNLLRLTAGDDFGVFELGTNHPGEIATLTGICQPQIAVITNIGLGHVEFFGDEAGVAKEKGTLLENLPADGFAVLNADDRWFQELRARTRAAVVTVGIENFADIRASEIKINGDIKFRLNIAKKRGDVVIRLRTLGRHQIYNALQAAAVGYMQGLDLDEIREGLETMEFPGMRMQEQVLAGIRFVNDCYNANVVSMKAALTMLRETPGRGRKIAVLGDMLELGAHAAPAHREIGELVAQTGVALLVTVGPNARGIADGALAAGLGAQRVVAVADAVEAAATLRWLLRDGDFVLLKGSRGIHLEKVLEAFALR